MSDSVKDRLCNSNSIRLIRIREEGLPLTDAVETIIRHGPSNADLEEAIRNLYVLLGMKNGIEPCINRDITDISSQYVETYKKNSLAQRFPEIAKRWHPTKNGELTPEHVSAFSTRLVWWICEKGHEYKQPVSAATSGNGCDICGRKLTGEKLQKKDLIVGVNDLKTLFPEVAKEWDYNENFDLPEDYKPGSNKKKKWVCLECGYVWEAQICNRTIGGQGCPKCAIEKVRQSKLKPVECVETGRIFSCLEDAAEWAGVSKSAISYCARGKTKHSGGYHWKYIEDYDNKDK